MTTWARAVFLAILMAAAASASAIVSPSRVPATEAPDLEGVLPDAFGVWRRTPLSSAVTPIESSLEPGEAVAYRAYKDDLGRIVTLVAAYGPPLGDSVRLHRPESCYVAQGYEISERRVTLADARNVETPIVHMYAANPSRRETVSYWLRSGDGFVTSPLSGQRMNFSAGWSQPLDGALIRISSSGFDPQFQSLHKAFLESFADALSPEGAALLLGREPQNLKNDRKEVTT